MKIRQLMIAMLGVFAMTACTQTDRAQESAESGEVPPAISSAQIAIHGNLKLCDPFASGGAATLDGYYYTVLRPDGTSTIWIMLLTQISFCAAVPIVLMITNPAVALSIQTVLFPAWQ